jgi:hypothetical protein
MLTRLCKKSSRNVQSYQAARCTTVPTSDAADWAPALPPDAERLFAQRMGATTVEVPTNHVAMVSNSDDVVKLIETAAKAVPVAP